MNTQEYIQVPDFQSRENLILELAYYKQMAITYQKICDDLFDYISLSKKFCDKEII